MVPFLFCNRIPWSLRSESTAFLKLLLVTIAPTFLKPVASTRGSPICLGSAGIRSSIAAREEIHRITLALQLVEEVHGDEPSGAECSTQLALVLHSAHDGFVLHSAPDGFVAVNLLHQLKR